jgi:hypothetical protein
MQSSNQEFFKAIKYRNFKYTQVAGIATDTDFLITVEMADNLPSLRETGGKDIPP